MHRRACSRTRKRAARFQVSLALREHPTKAKRDSAYAGTRDQGIFTWKPIDELDSRHV
jgi:hypothetical protein